MIASTEGPMGPHKYSDCVHPLIDSANTYSMSKHSAYSMSRLFSSPELQEQTEEAKICCSPRAFM